MKMAARLAYLFSCLSAAAALRVLPVCAPVHSISTAPRACVRAEGLDPEVRTSSEEDAEGGISQAQRKKYMNAMQTGVADGGWDNDEYLEKTKGTAPKASNLDLLKQAEAWVRAMEIKGEHIPKERLELIIGRFGESFPSWVPDPAPAPSPSPSPSPQP